LSAPSGELQEFLLRTPLATQKVLQILGVTPSTPSVAQVKAIVEPDGIGNDIWVDSTALVDSHAPILSVSSL
jgi:hypothetical protein